MVTPVEGRILSYTEAKDLKSRNPNARWSNVSGAFSGEVWPQLSPSFAIGAGDCVFTIGSCFARNIERHLGDLGCRVPMNDLHLPPEEWSGEPNGAMNKFHPPSFRQSLGWTAQVHDGGGQVAWSDCEAFAFDRGDGLFTDLDLPTVPVSKTRFVARRQHIYEIFSSAFSADCLIMTPGLIEAWRDKTTGLFIHDAPTQKALAVRRDRWELVILSYQQCLDDMLQSIDLVRARNPGVKILVTTSPVPMSATFSGQDVRMANSHSKAVLRAVCGVLPAERPLVDYFPSYEIATLSAPAMVWKDDRIHVSSDFVGKIVTYMLDQYMAEVADAERHYHEANRLIYDADYAGAEKAARMAVKLKPDYADAHMRLAEALFYQARYDQAEDELTRLLQIHPDRADAQVLLARTIEHSDPARIDEAIAHIEAASELPAVTLADFRKISGLIRRSAPPQTAERVMQRAVERFPLHLEARMLLADVLLDQGRNQEAIEALQAASKMRRVDAGVHIRLAGLLQESERFDDASTALRLAFDLEPDNAAARALAVKIAAHVGK